jgi:pSer/pThr/pTyr-binding forkhead associated (FHA) protein
VWTLTDLGSTNGTQLNGQTVQQRALADGDRITIGTTVLEFREDGR